MGCLPMDVANSQLIIVLFLLFSTVVSLAAYFGFRNIAVRAPFRWMGNGLKRATSNRPAGRSIDRGGRPS